MSAYRQSGSDARGPDRGGVVEQIVRQFADRYAFVRELCQNSIDAGASAVRVVVDETGPTGVVRVEDDGKGMTLEIIEGPLLTLFSSSKEGQRGKIGRYGVGFMSVFAVEPTAVIVETWRAEGSHVVTIGRDHAFEVREAARREGSGTYVSLVLGPDSPSTDEIGEKVVEAARRWCRHVTIPVSIAFRAEAIDVNVPFALRAPVVIEEEAGDTRVLVGPSAGTSELPGDPGHEGTGDFAGFYAHGLTLLETTEPPTALRGVRFKIASTELAHTISRDDVKRDAAFRRAMSLVERIVKKQIRSAVEEAQHDAAQGWARSGPGDGSAVARFVAARAMLKPASIFVPLLELLDGAAVIPLTDVEKLASRDRAFAASSRGRLTRALAKRGFAIVRTEAGAAAASSRLCAALGLLGLPSPEDRFVLLEEREVEAGERVLLDRLASILNRLRAPTSAIRMVRVAAGRLDRAGVVVGAPAEGAWVLPEVGSSRTRVLALVADHPAVARALASGASRETALLARLLLLEAEGPLTPERADALLDAAMELPT